METTSLGKNMNRSDKAINDRVNRACVQPIRILEKRESAECVHLQMLGSTGGNVYETTFYPTHATCACIDWRRNGMSFPCKHILYVYVKVLQIPTTSLYTSVPDFVEAYTRARNLVKNEITRAVAFNVRCDTDCCICYDSLGTLDTCVECTACKHLVHRTCIDIWLKRGRTKTCPMCRHNWRNRDTANTRDEEKWHIKS